MRINIRMPSLLLALLCLLYVPSQVTSHPKSSSGSDVKDEIKQIETQIQSAIPPNWKITSIRSDSLPFGWDLQISEKQSKRYRGHRITIEKPGSKKTASGDKGQGSQLPRPFAVTVWFIPLSKGLTLQQAVAERGSINSPAQQAIARLVGANEQYLLAEYVETEEERKVLSAITKKLRVVSRR